MLGWRPDRRRGTTAVGLRRAHPPSIRMRCTPRGATVEEPAAETAADVTEQLEEPAAETAADVTEQLEEPVADVLVGGMLPSKVAHEAVSSEVAVPAAASQKGVQLLKVKGATGHQPGETDGLSLAWIAVAAVFVAAAEEHSAWEVEEQMGEADGEAGVAGLAAEVRVRLACEHAAMAELWCGDS
eukprot:6201391-Pleurochrysis_carterae.AAC.1